MENRKQRKTDRRTLYTVEIIKESLLELLKKTSFNKITVSGLCRQAEITRTTFYLHYTDISAVLDELLNEALQVTEEQEECAEPDTLLPACQRIADSPKYRPLFLDDSLTGYIINTIYRFEKQKIVPKLIKEKNITVEEAEVIFRFMLHGSFAVNKELRWKKDEKWYRCQKMLLEFIRGRL